MHVQRTCKCFAPIAVLVHLQAKRWASLMRNLQVTCILSRRVCFFVSVSVGCSLRAPTPLNFIREGSSGSGEFLAIDTKFGTLMEFNECISMVHAIS